MKLPTILSLLLVMASTTAALLGWRAAGAARDESDRLRQELAQLRERTEQESGAAADQHARALHDAQANAAELIRLRGEVSQLRTTAREADTMRVENQRLRAENKARSAAPGAGTAPASESTPAGKDHFPRDGWTFAGYASPESSLISAIWAMKEGNPKSYLDSLSPEEQTRIAKTWENKSEAEIAAKHQGDVSAIGGIRILERQEVSPEEVVMNVYLDSVGRMERVSMKRIGADWKFNGFVRNPGNK